MQPQNIENHGGPEQLPVQPPLSGERIPVLPSVEGGIETGAERREQTADAQAAAADAAAFSQPVQPVAVQMPDPVAPVSVPTLGPVTANDDDVIEKEWVDKAKQILAETKDDPHQRSNRVNELQKDYLKKRYGKELGAQPQ